MSKSEPQQLKIFFSGLSRCSRPLKKIGSKIGVTRLKTFPCKNAVDRINPQLTDGDKENTPTRTAWGYMLHIRLSTFHGRIPTKLLN